MKQVVSNKFQQRLKRFMIQSTDVGEDCPQFKRKKLVGQCSPSFKLIDYDDENMNKNLAEDADKAIEFYELSKKVGSACQLGNNLMSIQEKIFGNIQANSSSVAVTVVGAQKKISTEKRKHIIYDDSALFTRKHAIKLPRNLTSPNLDVNFMTKRLLVTEIEKAIYEEVTKVMDGAERSRRIVDINGAWVDQRTLRNALKMNGWVCNFCISVFINAIMADQAENSKFLKYIYNAKLSGYLKNPSLRTEDIIDYFLEEYVGFSLECAQMVMMPVLERKHWWLFIANFRDKRFDILSSDFGMSYLKT